ncbi:MAG: hypothetical protein E4H20_12090, partial [Spirochaetales bacterium]
MSGCMGKVLIVDLSSGLIRERAIAAGSYRDWIGGAGLAALLLTELIPGGADPLGPDNVLAFMPGRLTGTGAVMTGRWTVCTKSPLTGGWGDANCGGTLAPEIKRCGWDGILFRGIAVSPVLFVADEAGPRLEDASCFWGLDAVETEERLAAAHAGRRKPAVAAIGPAAERLSLISGISNDGGRYAARSGVGAVMGSKRLKAIVLSGSIKIPCSDPARVKVLSASYAAKMSGINFPSFVNGRFLPLMGHALGMKTVFPMDGIMAAGIFKKWGTIYNNTAGLVNGDSPVRNWSGSVKDFGTLHYRRLDPDRIIARETKKYNCYSCVIGCGGICEASGTGAAGSHMHKPEYETCCAFGPLLLNHDLDSIFLCNDLCNRSGFDTISAGATVAFALECWERGIITAADTGGLQLRWGDSSAIVALLKMMIAREGIGDILADGVARAAERIGKGAQAFAVHAGGQEPGMHDGRFDPMMATMFAADPTPGRHTIGAAAYYNVSHLWDHVSWAPAVTRPYPKADEYDATEVEAMKAAAMGVFKQVLDAAGGCLFALTTGLQHWRIFDMLNAATGESRTPDAWMEAGKRIHSARAAFNARHRPRVVGERSDGPASGYSFNPRIAGNPPM